ncbi:hypothetical protein [Mycolicibacterium fortuitum]|uniref:hypothetical protein n=1 Tax=Mycolicibacterium fortuitum TaxID=1766 RepID=UPI00260D2CA5|nr:hypothetical protein [Mycolicibacterium fortuitum]
MPRAIDTGCSHFCLRVTDITAASTYLRDQGVAVLGRPMRIDSGPLKDFHWQYFHSPWGGYFEIQQWAPGKPSRQVSRLATHSDTDTTASIPTVVGLDHAGFVVVDIEAAITALESIGGSYVLGSVVDADQEFMLEQFQLAATGTMRMAMVRFGDVNLELFQHDATIIHGAPQRVKPPLAGVPGHTVISVSLPPSEPAAQLLESLGLTVALGFPA